MKTMTFDEAIRNFCEERAEEDKLFARAYKRKDKSVEECCDYIKSVAKKNAKNGMCAISDDEVYQMVIHYFNSDEIKGVKKTKAKVVAPATAAATTPKKKTTAKATKKTMESEYALEIPLF